MAQPPNRAASPTGSEDLSADWVRVAAPDGEIPAYQAMPSAGGPFPVVLVAPEIFGVNENIRAICRRFAGEGYLAIAPDFFARQGDVSKMTDHQEIVSKVISKVPDAQVMTDLDAAAGSAAQSGRGDIRRLTMTGFCWGGRIVWLYAAYSGRLRAAAAWYGRLAGDPDETHPRYPIDAAADLKCPVLGLYGGVDRGIPLDTVERMRAAIGAAHGNSRIEVYPGAGHGFFADYRPSYHPSAAEDGWRRLQLWFRQHGA